MHIKSGYFNSISLFNEFKEKSLSNSSSFLVIFIFENFFPLFEHRDLYRLDLISKILMKIHHMKSTHKKKIYAFHLNTLVYDGFVGLEIEKKL